MANQTANQRRKKDTEMKIKALLEQYIAEFSRSDQYYCSHCLKPQYDHMVCCEGADLLSFSEFVRQDQMRIIENELQQAFDFGEAA
jgi:hypothetical protein